MSSDAMAIHAAEVGAGRPWVQLLHEWVTTVDHKRLGILYVLLALMFLIITGVLIGARLEIPVERHLLLFTQHQG